MLTLLSSSAPETDALLRLAGRLHVLAVHFPIALLWFAALVELLRVVGRREGRSPVVSACLAGGALSAAAAAGLGWLHAEVEPLGSSLEDTLFLHRWLGVATAVVAVNAWGLSYRRGPAYLGALALTLGLVTATGHLGGVLVFGDGWLLAGLRAPAEDTPEAPADDEPPPERVAFAADVFPLLEARCFECHGPRRQKAGLRFDDLDAALALEPDEATGQAVIVPGDAGASAMIRRVELPPDHEDAMPAKGDPLTAAEVATLRAWIDQGARRE